MEMEHINENTIRVLIESTDLEERGITFLDLLGNHKQIEDFFYSILEEVDVDEKFHESDAITFQVLPSGNGLELFISKGGPLSEDIDFSSTSGNFEANEFSKLIKKQLMDDDEEKEEENFLDDSSKPTQEVVLRFNEFEDMISLSKQLYLESATSKLYWYKNSYFLYMIFFIEETTERSVEDQITVALEFTQRTPITQGILMEHGRVIMENNALELSRFYFK
ncbi:adapter protein MecA 1/2 [Carnobacterium iners]|uniref:Adapter protein MecA n=1 Tax=Carnobacterium iners TaxID=1073423 RepID=A0A1X7NPK4_9LACT|nr:adaptor protein MecA [Carnobacterium iners]SEK28511.1 adapter protein MecA 1/2 [Carnobacterium iners]SMH39930.1 adapter protein MecA 1/2 [Carnobacterium iners]